MIQIGKNYLLKFTPTHRDPGAATAKSSKLAIEL